MLEHARNLEFEKAAQARDQLARLKARVFGAGRLHDQVEPEPSPTSAARASRAA